MLTRNPSSGTSILLAVVFALLFASAGVFSLAHRYGEHAHGHEAGDCALCAFACHVAVVFLVLVSSSCLAFICRFRQRPLSRRTFGTNTSLKLIRAPPLLSSTA
jgi:hypothetical protein